MLTRLSNITSQYPQKIAICYQKNYLTFSKLNELSDILATIIKSKLNSLSTVKNRAVCFYMDRGINVIITILAILKANCYYVALDKKYPIQRLRFIVENTDPVLILSDSHCDFATDQQIVFGLTDFFSNPIKFQYLNENQQENQQEKQQENQQEQDLAYICYTSGTTSVPKGVLIRRSGLLNLITSAINILQVNATDRVLQYSSISFDASGWDIYIALLSGATICMISDDMMISPQECHTYINNEAITLATLTPTFLAEMPTVKLSALKNLIVMGDMADSKNMEFWCRYTNVYNGYGPTECTIGTTMHKFSIGDNPANIGKPFDNYSVYLLNDNFLESNPGMIYVGGPGVAVGYLKLDELTQQKFVQTKFGLLYKTGDMASRDLNGDIIFIGRIDNQVKINGVRIELEEIENLAMSIDVISRCCVVRCDNLLILYYTLIPGKTTTNEYIREYLAKYLHSAVVPAKYQHVPKFELNPNGKIAKDKLFYIQDEKIDGDINEITEIYGRVLLCKYVDINSNYFELGGDSLKAYKISMELQKINIFVNPTDVLRYPIIENLIKYIIQKNIVYSKDIIVDQSTDTKMYHCVHNDSEKNYQIVPLSHIQIDMWYFQLLYPYDPSYNMHIVMILENINIDILKKSYSEIFKKHLVLRTRIFLTDNVPYQTFDKEIEEIQVLPYINDAQIREEIDKPFDLLNDNLVRIKIFSDQNKYFIVTVKHGIIIDAFSENILKKDLSNIYNRLLLTYPLGINLDSVTNYNLPLDYVEISKPALKNLNFPSRCEKVTEPLFLAPENTQNVCTALYIYRNFLNQPSNKKYWKNYLKHSQELNLEKNFVEKDVKTHHINKDFIILDLVEKIATNNNTTVYIMLLTVINIVLFKYSQTHCISIGTQIAMRNKEEWKDIVGFMVSTLVSKNTVSDKMTISELINTIANNFYNSMDNPIISFSKLLKYSAIPIDFMFVMENVTNDDDLIIGSSTAKYLDYDNNNTGFPISWYVYPNKKNNSLQIRISHSAKYDTRLIGYMLDSFDIILNNIDKCHKIKDLSYLPINPIIRGPKIDHGDNTIISIFLKKVLEYPSKSVVHFSSGNSDYINENLTYLQIDNKSNHIASILIQKYNIYAGDIIAVAINRSEDFVCLLLGILKTGACYVPMDPTYPIDRLNYMIADCMPKMVIVRNLDKKLDCKNLVIFDDLVKNSIKTYSVDISVANGLAYIIYTSGSTGNPKACRVTHRSIVNVLLYFASKIKINTSDIFWNITSTSFDIMVLEVFLPLLTASLLYICPPCVATNPVQLVEWINRDRPTVLQATPTLFSIIANHINANPQMRILVGGEPLTNNVANMLFKITKYVYNTYGPTETTIWSMCARIKPKTEISIGKPISNTECIVLNDLHKLVPPMSRGQLYIGGHGVCAGYLNRPNINIERFIMFNEKKYYNTGDVVIYDGQSFNYIGRNDFQIKVNGHRIEIGEIINILEGFISVKNVAIKPIVYKTNTYLVAYIVATQIINQACILDFAREKLPNYMVPNFLIQMSRFPETLNGKINMAQLPSPFDSNDNIKYIHTDVITKPKNDIEQKVYEICNDIIGVNEFSTNESLFNIGLQSIMICRFISKIKEIFGIVLTTCQFIKNSTVLMCAKLIEELYYDS